MTILYRYETSASGVYLTSYQVVKETPKGVRLNSGRFVLRSAKKQFAHATLEEARQSYIARKRKHITILKDRLKVAEAGLEAALKGPLPDRTVFEFEPEWVEISGLLGDSR